MIFLTGYGDVPMSVQAMKAGAVEFLTKPFRDQDLLDAIQQAQALERDRAARKVQEELAALRERPNPGPLPPTQALNRIAGKKKGDRISEGCSVWVRNAAAPTLELASP
jgi:DNA-binding NtrC family response regulator